MKVVVLAGGRGTRLAETENRTQADDSRSAAVSFWGTLLGREASVDFRRLVEMMVRCGSGTAWRTNDAAHAPTV